MPDADHPNEPIPVFCVTHDGIVTFVSSTSLDVGGLSPERFHGRHIFDLVHPDDRHRVEPLLAPGWAGRFDEILRIQEADGTWSPRRVQGIRTISASQGASAAMTLRKPADHTG